ncbi:MAG: S41 family peptidase [Clostridiales bacterium]|nr:S41 family peptidase [Clostridiales bacterium]
MEPRKNHGALLVVAWCLSALLACGAGFWIGRSGSGQDKKLAEITNLIQNNYYQDVSQEQIEEGVLHGAVLALGDPYSAYMNVEEKQSYNESLEGAYVGIGVLTTFNSDWQAVIAQVYNNSPAQKAGLQKGDIFVAVDGQKINTMSSKDLSEVTGKIRGEAGTSVEITIERNGQEMSFTVQREEVHITYVTSRMLANNIGYIKIDEFSGSALEEYQQAVAQLQEQGMQAMILDLRDNPGGFVDYAVEIADELLPKATIISVRDKNGNEKQYTSDSKSMDFPMAVLVNQNSASASEILTVALKENQRAAIIGEKTYGKGIIQSHFNLSWGGYLKLTTASYYSPNGNAIHEVGVMPDIEVFLPQEIQNDPSLLTDETDTQLQKAIEILTQS